MSGDVSGLASLQLEPRERPAKRHRRGVALSELLAPFRRYAASGEINSRVQDQAAKIEELAERYADGRRDRLDGLTVEFDDWWFNVRASNTEPLLRLNVEAKTESLLKEKTDEVLDVIRGREAS